MKKKLNDCKEKFLHGGGLISTFLRSAVSSQVASWTDLGMSFLFHRRQCRRRGELLYQLSLYVPCQRAERKGSRCEVLPRVERLAAS